MVLTLEAAIHFGDRSQDSSFALHSLRMLHSAENIKMVSFFQKVPRELRDQIYRELLVDNVHSVDPNGGRGLDRRIAKKQLCPAILRTCQQAYAEALAMLYEENVFRFTWYLFAGCSDKILAEHNFSRPRLDKIKKVRSPYTQWVKAKSVGY